MYLTVNGCRKEWVSYQKEKGWGRSQTIWSCPHLSLLFDGHWEEPVTQLSKLVLP